MTEARQGSATACYSGNEGVGKAWKLLLRVRVVGLESKP